MVISKNDMEVLDKLNWPHLNINHLNDLDLETLHKMFSKLKQDGSELTVEDIIEHIVKLPNAKQFSPQTLKHITEIASKYLT